LISLTFTKDTATYCAADGDIVTIASALSDGTIADPLWLTV